MTEQIKNATAIQDELDFLNPDVSDRYENPLLDYELTVDIIAEEFSDARYEIVSKKILAQVEAGYYDKSEHVHTLPEAFYSSYKMMNEDDIFRILKQKGMKAEDGYFTTESGFTAEYKDIMLEVLNPKNIEEATYKFLRSNFGEFQEQQYKGNLKQQKIIAEEMFKDYFLLTKKKVEYKEIKDKSIYTLFKELESVNNFTMSLVIPDKYKDKVDRKFGVPLYMIINNGKVADFSACVEVKHMLTDERFKNKIQKALDDGYKTPPVDLEETFKNRKLKM